MLLDVQRLTLCLLIMIHLPLLILVDYEGNVGDTYLANLCSMYMRIVRAVIFLFPTSAMFVDRAAPFPPPHVSAFWRGIWRTGCQSYLEYP